ncbi:MAG TPA: hypothetical protein V6C91_11105, partial [Coleofasciculaceae cyanobacterium]
ISPVETVAIAAKAIAVFQDKWFRFFIFSKRQRAGGRREKINWSRFQDLESVKSRLGDCYR